MYAATLYFRNKQSHKTYLWLCIFIVGIAALVSIGQIFYRSTPTLLQEDGYSKPLVITKGGTYTGNWESRNSEIPAVDVRTSEPVIIINSNIRSAGYLIRSWGNESDITVKHTRGYGLPPT